MRAARHGPGERQLAAAPAPSRDSDAPRRTPRDVALVACRIFRAAAPRRSPWAWPPRSRSAPAPRCSPRRRAAPFYNARVALEAAFLPTQVDARLAVARAAPARSAWPRPRRPRHAATWSRSRPPSPRTRRRSMRPSPTSATTPAGWPTSRRCSASTWPCSRRSQTRLPEQAAIDHALPVEPEGRREDQGQEEPRADKPSEDARPTKPPDPARRRAQRRQVPTPAARSSSRRPIGVRARRAPLPFARSPDGGRVERRRPTAQPSPLACAARCMGPSPAVKGSGPGDSRPAGSRTCATRPVFSVCCCSSRWSCASSGSTCRGRGLIFDEAYYVNAARVILGLAGHQPLRRQRTRLRPEHRAPGAGQAADRRLDGRVRGQRRSPGGCRASSPG